MSVIQASGIKNKYTKVTFGWKGTGHRNRKGIRTANWDVQSSMMKVVVKMMILGGHYV